METTHQISNLLIYQTNETAKHFRQIGFAIQLGNEPYRRFKYFLKSEHEIGSDKATLTTNLVSLNT